MEITDSDAVREIASRASLRVPIAAASRLQYWSPQKASSPCGSSRMWPLKAQGTEECVEGSEYEEEDNAKW